MAEQKKDPESLRHPPTTYDTKYPYNKVFQTEGGHQFEFDDTPGKERIRIGHKTGTYHEISFDGRVVSATVKHHYHYGKGGATFTVDQSSDIKIAGGKRYSVSGDIHHEIKGDHHTATAGDRISAINGSHSQSIKGNSYGKISGHHTSKTDGDTNHVTMGDHTMKLNKNSLVKTAKDHTNDTGGSASHSAGKNISHSAGESMSHSAGKDMSHSANNISQTAKKGHSITAESHTINAETNIKKNLKVDQTLTALSGTFGTATSTIGNDGITTSGYLVVNGHTTANTVEFRNSNNEIASFGGLMTYAIVDGDYYIAINAEWDEANTEWNRINTANPAWLWQYNQQNNLVGEPAKYTTLWRCVPGSNPIGNFTSIDGWLLVQSFSEWGDATIGGFGIEIDGHGTVPFGRIRRATVSSAKYADIITNAYLDESNVDNASYPSYACGIVESGTFEGFKVRRAPAASGSPVWADLFSVDDNGFGKFGEGKTVASLPAANTALAGKICWVTDASSPAWNTTLSGGGSDKCLAFCTGSAWVAK
jgi:hypothetical protein